MWIALPLYVDEFLLAQVLEPACAVKCMSILAALHSQKGLQLQPVALQPVCALYLA